MKKENVLIGIILVAFGIIIFGNQNEFWDINIFFKGWWTLFIIIPSFTSIFNKEFLSGILGLVIGGLLLLSVYKVIVFESIWPLFIVIIGLILIFKTSNKKETVGKNKYTAIFSGNDNIVTGPFKSTDISVIFGGVDLNLKKAEINENININCLCLFGGVDIIVPENIVVKVKGVPIFGAIENKTNTTEGKEIVINATCLFGGITIK